MVSRMVIVCLVFPGGRLPRSLRLVLHNLVVPWHRSVRQAPFGQGILWDPWDQPVRWGQWDICLGSSQDRAREDSIWD